jgi:hypothetical protein
MVSKKLSKIDYHNIAGDNWPSYDDYLSGITTDLIEKEIQEKIVIDPSLPPDTPPYRQEENPEVAYSYVLTSHPRGIQYKGKITNTCNRPWKTVTIDMFTNCILCVCDGWLPKSVGEITNFDRLEDIWRNQTAYTIQEDIKNKKFTWCAVEHCGIKYSSNLESTYQLVFGIDDSCNLKCPSCRRDMRMYKSGPLFDKKANAVKHTIKLLNNFEMPIHITLATSGDPLASHIYRPFLYSYIPKVTQTFTLFTNGLLIKKQLDKTALLNRITEFKISIDAASEKTYEAVRLGGKWNLLIENLNFLKEKKLNNLITLQFIVQQRNYRDIKNFENLCEYYECCGIITQLDDWGTWINEDIATPDKWTLKFGTFMDNNVLNSSHKNYDECVEIIKSIQSKRVQLSNRLKELMK